MVGGLLLRLAQLMQEGNELQSREQRQTNGRSLPKPRTNGTTRKTHNAFQEQRGGKSKQLQIDQSSNQHIFSVTNLNIKHSWRV